MKEGTRGLMGQTCYICFSGINGVNPCPVCGYDNAAEGIKLTVKKGMFAIFMPQDGHKPSCMLTVPEPIRKAVVKVRVK